MEHIHVGTVLVDHFILKPNRWRFQNAGATLHTEDHRGKALRRYKTTSERAYHRALQALEQIQKDRPATPAAPASEEPKKLSTVPTREEPEPANPVEATDTPAASDTTEVPHTHELSPVSNPRETEDLPHL